MLFAWLFAQLPLQVALPISFGIEASLRLFAPTPEPDWDTLYRISLSKYMRSLPWAESADIYDGYIYSPYPVAAIPGLLVASPTASVEWTTTAIIFDEHVYGYHSVPIIPGLLVASPPAPVHWSASALIFDGHVYGSTPVPLIPGLLVASPASTVLDAVVDPAPPIINSALLITIAGGLFTFFGDIGTWVLTTAGLIIRTLICGLQRCISYVMGKRLGLSWLWTLSSALLVLHQDFGMTLDTVYAPYIWLSCIVVCKLSSASALADNLRRQLEATQKHAREQERATVSARETAGTLEQRLASSEQSFQASTAQCHDLEGQVAMLHGRVEEVKEERDTLTLERAQRDTEHEEKSAALEARVQSYKTLAENSSAVVTTLSASNATLTTTIASLDEKYAVLSQSYSALSSSHAVVLASLRKISTVTKSIESRTKDHWELSRLIGDALLDVEESVSTVATHVKNVERRFVRRLDQVRGDYVATTASLEIAHTAKVNALAEEAAIAKRNDTESWKEVAGLRIDLGVKEAEIEEKEAELERMRAPPSPAPQVEIPAHLPESASLASLFAASPAPSSSSDNLLAVALPTDVSSTSIDCFEPIAKGTPNLETYWCEEEDVFRPGSVVAFRNARLTASAPSSPRHRFAATRRVQWANLQPSASDPF